MAGAREPSRRASRGSVRGRGGRHGGGAEYSIENLLEGRLLSCTPHTSAR